MPSPSNATPHPAMEEAASNNEPVDEDVKIAARAVIVSGEAVLRDIKRALAASSYNNLVSRLEETELRVLSEIERCRSIASKYREMPVEILQQIFTHCAALQPITVWHLPEPNSTTALPWSLTAVCVKWRAIALNTPALWTRIHALTFKFISGPQQKSSALYRNALGESRLTHILSRSRGAPLSLRITWLDDWAYAAIPRLLRATAAQIKSLDFRAAPVLQHAVPGPKLLAFLDFLASEPESLDFAQVADVHLCLQQAPMSLRFLRSARNMSALTLLSTYHAHPLCLNSLPEQLHLEKLTQLQIIDRGLPNEVLYKIICHCPMLEGLVVTTSSVSYADIPGVTRNELPSECQLPDLNKLVIYVCLGQETVDATLWWFERLRLPRLRTLDLLPNPRGGRGQWSCPPHQLQVIQESNILQRLTLDISMYMNDLLRLLEALHRLEHVELRNVCPAPPIVRRIAQGDLLPNLSHLKCGLYQPRLEEYLLMLRLRTVRSRRFGDTIRSLKRVEFALFPPETPEGVLPERGQNQDWTLHKIYGPTTCRDFKTLKALDWKIRLSPRGWRECVREFTSPQAVGLLVFYAK